MVKNSKLIIEFHPKSKNENEKFLNNLKEFFDLEIIYKKLNNLENIKFLQKFSDIDRMLACNEDRTFLQHWIFCNPKNEKENCNFNLWIGKIRKSEFKFLNDLFINYDYKIIPHYGPINQIMNNLKKLIL